MACIYLVNQIVIDSRIQLNLILHLGCLVKHLNLDSIAVYLFQNSEWGDGNAIFESDISTNFDQYTYILFNMCCNIYTQQLWLDILCGCYDRDKPHLIFDD